MITKFNEFLSESTFYPYDYIWIHYWYNQDVVLVKILEKQNSKYLVSFDVENSKYKEAPTIWIKESEIISIMK